MKFTNLSDLFRLFRSLCGQCVDVRLMSRFVGLLSPTRRTLLSELSSVRFGACFH